MKPLTIEELKALEVGDWVWYIDLRDKNAFYVKKNVMIPSSLCMFLGRNTDYSDYGTKWLAYKNKEQAEEINERFTRQESTYYEKSIARLQELENRIEKGEIVEVPCIRKSARTIPKYEVVFINEYDAFTVERYEDEKNAERRLAELKGE